MPAVGGWRESPGAEENRSPVPIRSRGTATARPSASRTSTPTSCSAVATTSFRSASRCSPGGRRGCSDARTTASRWAARRISWCGTRAPPPRRWRRLRCRSSPSSAGGGPSAVPCRSSIAPDPARAARGLRRHVRGLAVGESTWLIEVRPRTAPFGDGGVRGREGRYASLPRILPRPRCPSLSAA